MAQNNFKQLQQECSEPFYYGKRLKALLLTYKKDGIRFYEVICYKHKGEEYERKLFFDNRIKPDEYKKQNDLYVKAHEYALNYLNKCVF